MWIIALCSSTEVGQRVELRLTLTLARQERMERFEGRGVVRRNRGVKEDREGEWWIFLYCWGRGGKTSSWAFVQLEKWSPSHQGCILELDVAFLCYVYTLNKPAACRFPAASGAVSSEPNWAKAGKSETESCDTTPYSGHPDVAYSVRRKICWLLISASSILLVAPLNIYIKLNRWDFSYWSGLCPIDIGGPIFWVCRKLDNPWLANSNWQSRVCFLLFISHNLFFFFENTAAESSCSDDLCVLSV